jgi:hypothetical protein
MSTKCVIWCKITSDFFLWILLIMPDHGRYGIMEFWITGVWPVLKFEVKTWTVPNSHLYYLKAGKVGGLLENLT